MPASSEQLQRSLGSGVIVDAVGLVVTNNHVDRGRRPRSKSRSPTSASSRPRSCSRISARPRRAAHQGRARAISRRSSSADPDALQVGDHGARDRQSVRGRADRDPRHRVGGGAHAGRHHRLSVLHPDRRRHQSRQFRRRAGRSHAASSSASTRRSSRARAARRASALPSPPTWCGSWSPPPRTGGTAVKRPWLGARLQAVTPEIAESLGPQAADGRAGGERRTAGAPAARGGLRTSDLIVGDRRHSQSTTPMPSTIASPPSRSAALRSSASCAQGREPTVPIALETAPRVPRDELVIGARSPFLGRQGVEPLAGACRRAAARPAGRRRRHRRASPTARRRRAIGFQQAATSCSRSTIRRSPSTRDLERATAPAERRLAHHHQARRAADFGDVERMTLFATCRDRLSQRGCRIAKRSG